MKEIWKPIDDRYSVSNFGRVKSNYANKEKILKPYPHTDGYLFIDIRHKGMKRKSIAVHRLVAFAFIKNPDPEHFDQVNHKDENVANNHVDNLEWCDAKYNSNYGTRNQRKAEACYKPLCSLDKNGKITHYKSRIEASKLTGISDTSISKVLSDNYPKNKTAGGMTWFYDDGYIDKMIKTEKIKVFSNKKPVYSIDENKNITYYDSVNDASTKTGINNISRAIKTGQRAGGKHWFYKE